MAEAATIASALIAQLLSKNNAEHGMCAVTAAGPKHKCVSGKDGFVSVDHAHQDDLLTQPGPGRAAVGRAALGLAAPPGTGGPGAVGPEAGGRASFELYCARQTCVYSDKKMLERTVVH